MTRGRWFLPDSPDVVGLLRGQLAVTIEGLDAASAWAAGEEGVAKRLVEIEHRGDTAKRELLAELRDAFVIPVAAEDVFALSRGIDWILDYTRDLVSEADAMACAADAGIGEMLGCLGEAARCIDEGLGALVEDGDRATAAADRAIEAERGLEHVYYRGMAELLEVAEQRERISRRELYRRCERIGTMVIDVAERVVYSVVKES